MGRTRVAFSTNVDDPTPAGLKELVGCVDDRPVWSACDGVDDGMWGVAELENAVRGHIL